jgi:hypothetical protein
LPAGGELEKLIADLAAPIRELRQEFDAPLATILAALGRDRQG